MAYEDLFFNPERVRKAVMFYERMQMPDDADEYFRQKQPYKTLNLLMMEGTEGEYVRVCREGQEPNGLNIRRWETTLQVMTDIFTAQCAYACQKAREGKAMPERTQRGERGVNFEMMKALGGTFAYTSTSKKKAGEGFVKDKEDPHLLTIRPAPGIPYLDYEDFLGDDYSNPKQREILLPPMVRMTWKFRGKNRWKEVDGVSLYDIQLTGFGMPLELEEEQQLLEILEAHAAEAADGLDDLAQQKEAAAVFKDPDHAYWKWKRAFRQLVLQRMQRIYESYYGEK